MGEKMSQRTVRENASYLCPHNYTRMSDLAVMVSSQRALDAAVADFGDMRLQGAVAGYLNGCPSRCCSLRFFPVLQGGRS